MAPNTMDWEYWYHKLMKLAHGDEKLAVTTIDEIHEKCGAFKNCDEDDRRVIVLALDELTSTVNYELFTAVEEMADYFGFNE